MNCLKSHSHKKSRPAFFVEEACGQESFFPGSWKGKRHADLYKKNYTTILGL